MLAGRLQNAGLPLWSLTWFGDRLTFLFFNNQSRKSMFHHTTMVWRGFMFPKNKPIWTETFSHLRNIGAFGSPLLSAIVFFAKEDQRLWSTQPSFTRVCPQNCRTAKHAISYMSMFYHQNTEIQAQLALRAALGTQKVLWDSWKSSKDYLWQNTLLLDLLAQLLQINLFSIHLT